MKSTSRRWTMTNNQNTRSTSLRVRVQIMYHIVLKAHSRMIRRTIDLVIKLDQVPALDRRRGPPRSSSLILMIWLDVPDDIEVVSNTEIVYNEINSNIYLRRGNPWLLEGEVATTSNNWVIRMSIDGFMFVVNLVMFYVCG